MHEIQLSGYLIDVKVRQYLKNKYWVKSHEYFILLENCVMRGVSQEPS